MFWTSAQKKSLISILVVTCSWRIFLWVVLLTISAFPLKVYRWQLRVLLPEAAQALSDAPGRLEGKLGKSITTSAEVTLNGGLVFRNPPKKKQKIQVHELLGNSPRWKDMKVPCHFCNVIWDIQTFVTFFTCLLQGSLNYIKLHSFGESNLMQMYGSCERFPFMKCGLVS